MTCDHFLCSRRTRAKRPFRGHSFHGYGGTSGSEETMAESSLESIESGGSNLALLGLGQATSHGRQLSRMAKISSADSLLSMIR